jgi:hypothetical protein
MGKSNDKRIVTQIGHAEPTAPEAPKEPVYKFRYVCEGCTGVAIKSTNNPAGLKIACQQCGKEQVTKLENYIVL